MPRRIPDYPDAFHGWNFISSFGSLLSVFATVIFLYLVFNLFTNTNTISDKVQLYYRNIWYLPAFYISKLISIINVPSANTVEFAVPSPIPTHVFINLPILGENLIVFLDPKNLIKIFIL